MIMNRCGETKSYLLNLGKFFANNLYTMLVSGKTRSTVQLPKGVELDKANHPNPNPLKY